MNHKEAKKRRVVVMYKKIKGEWVLWVTRPDGAEECVADSIRIGSTPSVSKRFR